jgi:serine/threonine-protein kinase
MIRTVLAVLILVLAADDASAQDWRSYRNARFGTVADVPRDWRAGRASENADGLAFSAPDAKGTITVSGGLHVWDTIAEAVEIMEASDDRATITYRHRGKRVLVVSGTRGDTVFYRKSILSCRDQIWNSVSTEYPAGNKAAYDALVTHVAGSLRFGGASVQIPNCR